MYNEKKIYISNFPIWLHFFSLNIGGGGELMALEKVRRIDAKTVIRKHVEVVKRPMHLMQLNKGLNLRQQRFFNLAILKVREGISEITWQDYKEIFDDETDHFYSAPVVQDIERLITLGIQTETENDVIWDNVFNRVKYDKKTFTYLFSWSPYMKERIENVRKNYVQQDLKTLACFKNKYSFVWYDYFKSNYRQWKWQMTKEEVIHLLRLEDKKSYLEKHAMMFKQCIESPLQELNEFTEYHITVDIIRKGRVVVGYEFKRFIEEEVVLMASEKQIGVLKEIVDRYGDTTTILREIGNFATLDADSVPYLMDLFFEIQTFKRYITVADNFTASAFQDVVALAIQKDNEFKAKIRELYRLKEDKPSIDDFIQEQTTTTVKPIFYNWLDERE